MVSPTAASPTPDPHARVARLKRVVATAAVGGFGAIAALITVNGLGGSTPATAQSIPESNIATPQPAIGDDDVAVPGDNFFQPDVGQPRLRDGGTSNQSGTSGGGFSGGGLRSGGS
jgi:uncharacterized membrane protein YgcG